MASSQGKSRQDPRGASSPRSSELSRGLHSHYGPLQLTLAALVQGVWPIGSPVTDLDEIEQKHIEWFGVVPRNGGFKGISCHSLRATGITIYLNNGGSLEKAQALAGHRRLQTTKLYDRRDDLVTMTEVERVIF